MPERLAVLGQATPAAATDTDLYTAPAATAAVVSNLFVTNRGTTTATIRISVRPGGAVIAPVHTVYHDIPLDPATTFNALHGLAIAAGTVITVRSSTADLSFTLSGSEIS